MPGGAIDQVTAEALAGAVAAYGLPVEATLAAYRAAHPGASAGDLLAAIQTDWYWRIPAIRLADAHAKSAAATYMYEFAWRSPQFNGRLGACHALEIAFVFDTLGKRQTEGRFWEPTLRNSSPTPCTPPGWRLPPMETAVGRSTISAAGQPCASIRRRRSWTILDPRSGRCGKACVSLCSRWARWQSAFPGNSHAEPRRAADSLQPTRMMGLGQQARIRAGRVTQPPRIDPPRQPGEAWGPPRSATHGDGERNTSRVVLRDEAVSSRIRSGRIPQAAKAVRQACGFAYVGTVICRCSGPVARQRP